MIQELVFTSAPKGLQLGSSGFCTVASTPGMAANLAKQLQGLSAYRHLNPPGSTGAKSNPVVYSHQKIKIGGKSFSILSRIADAGLDYSNRSNKLAHHFAVENIASLKETPSSILKNESQFFVNWNQDPTKLEPRSLVGSNSKLSPCNTWKTIVGDGGWAGDLIEAFDKQRTVYLIVSPTTPVLELIDEAAALLPLERQWDLTFSTFYTKTSGNIECNVRCVMDGSPEVALARRSKSNVVIDLTSNQGMSKSEFAGNARHGIAVGEKKSNLTPIGSELAKIEPGLADFFKPDLNEQIAQEAPSLDSKHTASPPVLMSGQPSYPIAETSNTPTLTTNYRPDPTPVLQSESKYPLVTFCAVLLVLILGLIWAYPPVSNIANVNSNKKPEPEKPEPEKPEPEKPEPEKPEREPESKPENLDEKHHNHGEVNTQPKFVVTTFEDIEKLPNDKVSNLKKIKERLSLYKKNPNENNKSELEKQFKKAVNIINAEALFIKIDTVNKKLEYESRKPDLDKIKNPDDTRYGYEIYLNKLYKLIKLRDEIRNAKEKFDNKENEANFKVYRATLEKVSEQLPAKIWSGKDLKMSLKELEDRLVKVDDIINTDQTNFGTKDHNKEGQVFKIKNYNKEKLNFIKSVPNNNSFELKFEKNDGIYRYKTTHVLGIKNTEYDKSEVKFTDLYGNSRDLYPAAITVDYISVRVDRSNNIPNGGIKIEDLAKYDVVDFKFEKALDLYKKNQSSRVKYDKPPAKIVIQKNRTHNIYEVVWKQSTDGMPQDFKKATSEIEASMLKEMRRYHDHDFHKKLPPQIRQRLNRENIEGNLKQVVNELKALYKNLNGLGYNGGNPVDQKAINKVLQNIKILESFPKLAQYQDSRKSWLNKNKPLEPNWENRSLNFSVRAEKKNGRGFVWIVCYFTDDKPDLEGVPKEPLNAIKTTPNQNQNQKGSISGLGVSPCGI